MREQSKHSTGFMVASWVAVALMLVIIFWFSAQTGQKLDSGLGIISWIKDLLKSLVEWLLGPGADPSPIGHFTEYLLLGIALANALRLHIDLRKAVVAATVLASVYGITDEIHQIFVPSRSCDPADWLVDTVAALIGALICHLIIKYRRSAEQQS